jgi:hypothetical protein
VVKYLFLVRSDTDFLGDWVYHVELPHREVTLVEGLPVESDLDVEEWDGTAFEVTLATPPTFASARPAALHP